MHQRPHPLRPLAAAAVLAAAALLGACGGGTAAAPAASPLDGVPTAATASVEAFTQFAASLPSDEQREPMPLDGVVPPTSETAEPAPVAR